MWPAGIFAQPQNSTQGHLVASVTVCWVVDDTLFLACLECWGRASFRAGRQMQNDGLWSSEQFPAQRFSEIKEPWHQGVSCSTAPVVSQCYGGENHGAGRILLQEQ